MEAKSGMSAHHDNPYVGPRTFSQAESHLFFGREREARDLLSLVVSERLVLFYAQSGAGKSSLLNARLIPALEAKGFEVLPVGRVSGELLPGEKVDNIFIHNLLLSLNRKGDEARPLSDPNLTLKDFLWNYGPEETTTPETELVTDTAADYEIWPRALIIDQFEEIFTTNLQDWRKRADFFSQLQEALVDDEYLWVVLTLREDYLASLDPYAYLLPGRLRARFYMQRMSYEAALEAVKNPVSQKRPFAPQVAEKLVNNLRQIQIEDERETRAPLLGEFVEPVQLQVVCYQLWENLKQDQTRTEITMADLERLAGGEDLAQFVDKALAEFYEQAIANCAENRPGRTGFDLRDWFETKLITKAKTRALVLHEAEQTSGLDNHIIKKLEDRFLLRAESRAGNRWYELVHDRFVEPILQANETWRRGHPLIQAAQDWKESGEPDSKLYLGQQLAEALHDPDAEIVLVLEFLEAGRTAEVKREKELTAVHQARLNRILKWGVTLLTLMAVIAIGAALFAFNQQRTAQQQAQLAKVEADAAQAAKATAEVAQEKAQKSEAEAKTARGLAEVRRQGAEAALKEADTRRIEAEQQSAIATSRQLAAYAVSSLESQPQLGLLLALEAVKVTQTKEAEDALRQAIEAAQMRTVLGSHTGKINAMTFSPDGRYLVTASDDHTAQVWVVATGKPYLSRPIEHRSEVLVVVFSHNGHWLATASREGTVQIFDVDNQTRERSIAHASEMSAMSFSPDSRLLVTAGVDGMARVWEVASGEEIATLEGHTGRINAVAWNPEGSRLATVSFDGTARVWEAETGNLLLPLSAHQFGVNAVAFSPDGKLLATAGVDGTARVWSAVTGDGIATLTGHTDSITTLAFSPSGTSLATGSVDRTARLWDVATGIERYVLQGHRDRINGLNFSPDGRFLATASADSTTRLWVVSNGTLQTTLQGHTSSVNVVAFSPDKANPLLATASSDNTTRLWDLSISGAQTILQGHEGGVYDLAFNHDSSLLASGDGSGIVHLWKVAMALDTGGGGAKVAAISLGNPGFSFSLAFSPDDQILATSAVDSPEKEAVKLWQVSTLLTGDAQTAKPVVLQSDQQGSIFDLAFSPDGKLLATGGVTPSVRIPSNRMKAITILWDISGQPAKEVATLPGSFNEWTNGVAFSFDGKLLATTSTEAWSSSGGAVRLWPVPAEYISSKEPGSSKDITELAIFQGQSGFSSPAFHPKQNVLAVSDFDGMVRLWDIAPAFDRSEAEKVTVLRGHEGAGAGLAFNSSGDLLATGGLDGIIRLWHVPVVLNQGGTNAEAATLRGHKSDISGLAFNHDGSLLASGSGDGTVRLWLIGLERLQDLACQHIATRNLSQDEWETYFGSIQSYRKTCPNLPVHPTVAQEYARQGHVAEALEALQETANRDRTLQPDKEVAEALVEQGREYLKQGDFDQALELLRQAVKHDSTVELDPNNPETTPEQWVAQALVEQGQRYIKQEAYQESLAAWQRAKELDPTSMKAEPRRAIAEAIVDQGQAYFEAGSVEQAEEILGLAADFDRSLRLKPEAELARLAGLTNARAGKLEEAVTALHEALRLDPQMELNRIPDMIITYDEVCQQIIPADLVELIHPLCVRAVELAGQTEDADLNNQLCQNAASAEMVEVVKPACKRAVELATQTEDGYLANQICWNVGIEGLAEVIGPACERAVELAAQTKDGYQASQVCQNAAIEDDLVKPACERAVELVAQTEDGYLASSVCLNARTEGLAQVVKPACERAVELAAQNEDGYQASQICQNAAIEGLVEVVQSACELTLDLAAQNEDNYLANQICQSAATRGLADAAPACELAVKLVVQSEDGNLAHEVCRNAGIEGLAEIVKPACERAVELAVQTEDGYLASNVCLNAGIKGLAEIVKPACERAVELAIQTEDGYLANKVCQNAATRSLTEITPACERAVELVVQSEDGNLAYEVCRNAGIEGLAEIVKPACERAVELAVQTEDGYLASNVCLNAGIEELAEIVKPACERAVELAAQTEDGYLASNVCLNAGIKGLAEIVKPACERAVELALPTEDIALNSQVCQSATGEDLISVIKPACERAVELAVQIEGSYWTNLVCQKADIEGLTETVFPACEHLLALAAETDSVYTYGLLCQNRNITPLTNLVLPACEHLAALASEIEFGDTVAGTVGDKQHGETWTFQGTLNDTITLTMAADDINFDPYLILLGPQGVEPTINDDSDGTRNSKIAHYVLPQTGYYIIIASGFNDSTGAYKLKLIKETE